MPLKFQSSKNQLQRSFFYRRLANAFLWIAVCVLGIWFSAHVGYARLLAKYASLTGNAVAGGRAVQVSPLDAQVHSARAATFYSAGLASEAARELEVAVSLRPRDNYLWLRLGLLRDELHDVGALAAFEEAVRRAPYYGHPKWQRGNYLLRSGRYDEAFADMRFAAASNESLVPSLIDLAWGVSRENSQRTQEWAGITDDRKRVAFARFLATHGKATEALAHFRASRVVPLQARRELLTDLIGAHAFREAFEIWRGMEPVDDRLTAIHDGGFEVSNTLDDSGFGWRFAHASQGARMSFDANQPHAGKQSLLVTFLGYSEPNTVLLSQLLLVEPNKHYRVNFNVRTDNLVTGGLPVITVGDASGDKKALGQSFPIGFEGSAWQSLSFDFRTDKEAAVELRLQRKPCNNVPCPIFGSLWLDNFAIEEVK
ncbi:MAG TPA: tetratricopeptide repeat protein [Pyrinomonadaceae bacterium]|nr:tetratricopeptide repeat protein [Pyrinomonadaceae bacterium]